MNLSGLVIDSHGVVVAQKLVSMFLRGAAIFALVLSAPVFAAETPPSLDSSTPCVPPEYPRASLANEEKGIVALVITVGVDGKAVEAKVVKSSGFRKLDAAASSSFLKCKFKPGTKDGKPDQQSVSIKFEFKLD